MIAPNSCEGCAHIPAPSFYKAGLTHYLLHREVHYKKEADGIHFFNRIGKPCPVKEEPKTRFERMLEEDGSL
jgi:hypothetical protein